MACLSMRDRISKSHLPIPDFVFPGYKVRHRKGRIPRSVERLFEDMEEKHETEPVEKPVKQVREEHQRFVIYHYE